MTDDKKPRGNLTVVKPATTEGFVASAQPEQVESALEKVVVYGDLKHLTPIERVNYYKSLCQSLDLNPLTRPFEYLTLDNRLVLYVRKDATEQLRKKFRVSVMFTEKKMLADDLYSVTARATLPSGRYDEATGVVSLRNKDGAMLRNQAYGNALMRGETKAKRRVTLSVIGLGMMDESEIEDTSGAPAGVDPLSAFEAGAITAPKAVAMPALPPAGKEPTMPVPATDAGEDWRGRAEPVPAETDATEPQHTKPAPNPTTVDPGPGHPPHPAKAATPKADGLPVPPADVLSKLKEGRWLDWLDWFVATLAQVPAAQRAEFAGAWDDQIETVRQYKGRQWARCVKALKDAGLPS